MTASVHIRFAESDATPIETTRGQSLADLLDGRGPIDFGCHAGVCGTCLARVRLIGAGTLPAKSEHEQALTAFYGFEEDEVRLLCLLEALGDLEIQPV